MSRLPTVKAIPVENSTDADLVVVLEPEGHAITLRPGQVLMIEMEPHDDAISDSPDEFDLEYRPGSLIVSISANKRASVDGKRIR